MLATYQNTFPPGLPDGTSILRIETATAQTRPGVHDTNAAIGGRTSAEYLDAGSIAQIAALGTVAAIFHMVGSNDYALSVPPETDRTNLTTRSLRSTPQSPASACISSCTSNYVTTPQTGVRMRGRSSGQVMKEVAAAASAKSAFFDVNRLFPEAGWLEPDPLNLVDTDNVHFTDAGRAFPADLLRRMMEIPLGQRETFILADTFSRPNNVALGNAETGQAWAPPGAAAPAVAAGKAKLTTGGRALIESGRADVDVSAVSTLGTGASQGIVFRAMDADNRLSLMFESCSLASTSTTPPRHRPRQRRHQRSRQIPHTRSESM